MYKNLIEKPFKLISIAGCVYLFFSILLNFFTDFLFHASIYPFAKNITFLVDVIVLILFVLSFFFYNFHIIYYAGIELLVFLNIYSGSIYIALFFSSFLLVIILAESGIISRKKFIVYGLIEILKLCLVIPYGITELFNYVALSLFSFCSIGCINLLFRHAYDKKDMPGVDLEELKLSERQKDCIKEIVLNNTTIKALAINHNVSESAIKKDLAHIYSILKINGKADLKALFIDYKF